MHTILLLKATPAQPNSKETAGSGKPAEHNTNGASTVCVCLCLCVYVCGGFALQRRCHLPHTLCCHRSVSLPEQTKAHNWYVYASTW
jgi:hypothetical protein